MFGKKSKECNITSRPGKPGKNYGDVGNYFDSYFQEKEADWNEKFAEDAKGMKGMGRRR